MTPREADPQQWEACRSEPDARPTCARPTDLFTGISLRVTAPREIARLFRAVLCALRKAIEAQEGRLPSEGDRVA